MITFTFFKLHSPDKLTTFEIESFLSINEARIHANHMLGNPDYRAIEIWDGERTHLVERDSHVATRAN